MIRVAGYPIDAALQERLSYDSEITQNPVEKGADVTDHIRAKLPVLEFEGVVSDTPIGAIATDPSRAAADGAQLPSVDAYLRFVAIHAARLPVTVECSFGRFESMALESLTPTKTSKEAKAFKFTATFRKIAIVENLRTTVRVAVPNAQGKQNFGLSLDKVVDGKHVLWRKGKPPGTSPATSPAGVITGQEVVVVVKGKFCHANKRPLTTPELEAFTLDLNRDSALSTRRGLARIDEQSASFDERLDRASKLLDYKNAHPGERVDPALFGL